MDPPFGPREGATRGPTDPPTSTPRPGHPGAGSPTPLDRSLSESELIEKLGQAPRVESLPTLSIRWRLIQQKKLLKIAYILSLGFVFLAAAASYLAIFPLEPRYFWVTPELRVMETTPLSESFISTASLVNWTARSLKEAFSLDYLHVDERLAKLKDNFSDTARTLLVEYLKNNGHLNKIINDRLVMASELTGAPVIVETRQGNPLTWVLEAPFTISYHSSTGSVSSRKVLATVEIQRVKTSQNPRGVEISRLTLSPVGAP
ncbi:MAG: DotI/IcmL family type IV secretion protein [Deltaproteobacteria bacterium]|nr:DotI/IcmL family type IV secretion protein [Deltaproteobacteria bacterium]